MAYAYIYIYVSLFLCLAAFKVFCEGAMHTAYAYNIQLYGEKVNLVTFVLRIRKTGFEVLVVRIIY